MEYGLSLGSNLDDKAGYLQKARQRLAQDPDLHLLAASALYETEPVDVQAEYAELSYINAVLVISTPLSPNILLERINRIEADLGRVREADRNAPRTIDIDILYAGDELIDSGGLTVPHPRWAQRAFVVVPLAEIRPDLILPGTQQTVSAHRQSLHDLDGVRKLSTLWE